MTETLLKEIYRSMARADLTMLPTGLRGGKMGWCLFLAIYSEISGNSRARHLSSVLMSETLICVRSMPTGLTEGLGGIIWALEYLKAKNMIEMDENLRKIYNYAMTERMVNSSTSATHNLEDPFLTSALYSLFSYKPAETAAHYMNVENLIYLTDECERIMTEPVKELYDPKQLPVSMLTSMLYFLKKVDAWHIYPFQIGRLLKLVPILFEEIKGSNTLDDYAYHVLMSDKSCVLEIKGTVSEAAKLLGTLGFYSLIYDCPEMFDVPYRQWLAADNRRKRLLRQYVKGGQADAEALCGLGFGLLKINIPSHED